MVKHTDSPDTTKKTKNWYQYLLFGFVGISLLAAAWFGWRNYQLTQLQNQLKTAIENQKQSIVQLQERESIGERMRAAEALTKASAERQEWSTLYQDLQTELQTSSKIKFKNVSVSEGRDISVQGEANDLLSAAGLLVLIDRSEKFHQGFLEAVSPGGNPEDPSYSFSAFFSRVPEDITPNES